MREYLREAAIAARQTRSLVFLIVAPEGIKVTAPAFGRVSREIVVPWASLAVSQINPLLLPIAELGGGY